MANNEKLTDQLNKDHSNKITKGSGIAFKKSTGLVAKGATKAASLAARISLKIIRRVITALCSSFVATIIVAILILSCLTGLIMGTAIKMTSETNMKQESPELTKAYLNLNKDEFKQKIYELVNDKDFNSYVLAGEFDNAYTKLVYGGTPAYTQKELKGYAKAEENDTKFIKFTSKAKDVNKQIIGCDKLIQFINNNTIKDIKKEFKKDTKDIATKYKVYETLISSLKNKINGTKDKKIKNIALNYLEERRKLELDEQSKMLKDGSYAKCTSLLQALQKYKDKGLKDSNIKINDDYLRGYGIASGYNTSSKGQESEEEQDEASIVMPFNKWINYSYYTIPYYFHVNQARHSTYKNQLGGTLTASMNFYNNLIALFGASTVKDVGKVVFGAGAIKYGKAKLSYSEAKKVSDTVYEKCKNKKKRNEFATKLFLAKAKQDKATGSALMAGGGVIYVGGQLLELNALKALFKTLWSNPELQYGCPNWNADTGDWRFMTYEYSKKFSAKEKNGYPSKWHTIWNDQSFLSYFLNKGGFGQTTPMFNWVDGLLGKNTIYDSEQEYPNTSEGKKNTQVFKKMSYKDILSTGFTKLYTESSYVDYGQANDAGSDTNDYYNPFFKIKGQSSDSDKVYGYPAQGVLLGYKMNAVEDSFESTWNEMLGYDGFYNYSAFSKHMVSTFKNYNNGNNEVTETDYKDIIRDLYIYNWEDKLTKGTKHSNYYNYLRKPNDIEKISQREDSSKYSVNNTLINTLREQFANYFINQIYYIYSDNIKDSEERQTETGGGSDYIHDFFLSDTVSKQKKIEFLQRSFYAMASGSSYTYQATEEYKVENGVVINKLNGQRVGGLELNTKIQVNYLNKLTTPISKITKAVAGGNIYAEDDSRNDDYKAPITDGKQGWGDNFTVYLDNDYAKAINRIKVFNSVNNKGWNNMGWSNEKTTVTDDMVENSLIDWPGCSDGSTEGTTNQGFKYIVAIDKDNKMQNLKIYYDGVLITKDKNKKESKTKCQIIMEIKSTNQNDLLAQKFTIKVNGQNQKFEKLFYKHINWNKDFYKTHKEDIDGQNYNFDVSMDKGYDKANFNINSLTAQQLSPEEITKFLNGQIDGSFPMFANITGDRDIVIDYNTAGFLTYEINEEKDDSGNITEVTAAVYMKFPDVDMETRLAYMWEKEGMLENAVKLYDIYNKQNNLKDAESKVDLNELIINYSANEELNDSLEKDVDYNSTLPDFINNEMIEAAFETQVKYGVPCSSTFAQIIAESGFGKYNGLSGLARKNHNLFGMKSGNNKWTAGSCNYATKEQSSNGTTYGINASFSNYKTFKDSIYDRADLLTNFKRVGYGPHTKPYLNTRYMNGKKTNKEYTKTQAIKFIASYSYPNKPAWATSHEYLKTCTKHMNKYNLYQYDNMTLEEFKNGFSGSGNVSGEGISRVLSVAFAQKGKPYSQAPGRQGPSHFDCSGLVWYAFKKGAGIDIGQNGHGTTTTEPPRIQQLIKQRAKYKKSGKGWWVEQIPSNTPARNLVRGDVVYNSGHHVVFYVGQGRQFDASTNEIPLKQQINFRKFNMPVRTHIFRFHFPNSSGTISEKGVTLSNQEFKEKKKQSNFKLLSKKTNCTGYCSCAICCGKSNGVTASGKKLVPNYTCAVDTSIIPLGSTVYVYFKKDKKWHVYEAMDVGGAIKGSHIDLAFASHSKALTWGSKTCKVYYYTPPRGHN